MLTVGRLRELEFVQGEKNGRVYYQRADGVLVLPTDTGAWEFASDFGQPMSDGIVFTSEKELEALIKGI